MSFVRPEAAAALARWGWPAGCAAAAAALVWKGVDLLTVGAWVGAVPVALGALAALAGFGGIERALAAWRGRRGGPGMVVVEEGRISYFGPEGGAILARDLLTGVDIVTPAHGPGPGTGAGASAEAEGADVYWVLSDETGQQVSIPNGAADAGLLVDALGSLPGFDHRAVIAAMGSGAPGRVRIWRR